MKRFAALISSIVICFTLSACGGSGGTGGGGSDSPLGTAPSTPQGSANGLVTITKTSLVINETSAVSALFKKSDGTAAGDVSVTFSTTLGTLTPATAVTDTNGIATAQLTVGAVSGSGQVTASATVDGKLVSNNALFSVNLPPLKLSAITLGLSSLSFGGSTSVAVTVTDPSGNPFITQDVDVVFTSTQTTSGNAKLNSPVKTVNGVATTTYQAITATGADTITASIAGSSVNATVTVAPLSASSIQFVSASPSNIGLKGMGGAGIQESSLVMFRVLDTSGQPKANQQVDFALNTTVGGLSLTSSSGSTAADGTVSTTVLAGTIATPVRVTATLRGVSPAISTQSDQLVVSTGVPSQDGFSISIGNLNPESFNIDGVTTAVIARLTDHFKNPVPDGTAVSFTTSGGGIQSSCKTGDINPTIDVVTNLPVCPTALEHGMCCVVWKSQNPRPANARAVILAYAVGEEAFLDINGNGVADAGEFTDDSEAFRNDDESFSLSLGKETRGGNETFIDFNSDGIFNGPDGRYNGVLQGGAFVGAPKSKHVFSNSTIVMASSSARITNSCTDPLTIADGSSPVSCNFTITDVNGNTMPSGTTFEIITNESRYILTPQYSGTSIFTIPMSTSQTGTTIPLIIKENGTAPFSETLTLNVTSPNGLITSQTFTLNTP